MPDPLAPGPHYNYQEIADLAVVVRDAHNSWASAWMWLLQAKVVKDSSKSLPVGPSTDREIYLYEVMPKFTWHGKHSLGFKFQLKNDFTGAAADYKHWSFLCFEENAKPPPSKGFIDVRWPGSQSNGLAVSSFSDELLKLVTHFAACPVPMNVYGAPLNPHPEWDKLAQQILHKAKSKPQFGHASRVKGKQADVLICAFAAERHAGITTWVDARGHVCRADCNICFPGVCSEEIFYSSISTGFDEFQPEFDLSLAMHEKWNAVEDKSGDENDDKGRGDGGIEPPNDGDQRDAEDGGAGAKLTLFVDVSAKETEI